MKLAPAPPDSGSDVSQAIANWQISQKVKALNLMYFTPEKYKTLWFSDLKSV